MIARVLNVKEERRGVSVKVAKCEKDLKAVAVFKDEMES